MSVRLGLDAKLYFCAAGIGGTPTWTELSNTKNNTLNLQKGEADVTTRANNGWKATAGTLKEGSIEFEMVWDTADAGFTAIKNAFFGNSNIGIACMDGGITAAASQGLWADCSVIDFSRDEPLEEALSVKVTVKPTYSANAPKWVLIGLCNSAEPTTSAGANVYYNSGTSKYTFTSSGNTLVGKLLLDYTTGATVMTINVS